MEKHILEEAQRCLQCKKPRCRQGCPNNTAINDMVKLILEGKMKEAGKMLFENNPLSVICSTICPHENFCEGHCVLKRKGKPVQISTIENYISTHYLDHVQPEKPTLRHKDKIAIIGSGPSGITVAFILASYGYDITIFESEDKIGGVLQYGIPDFRLPKELLEKLRKQLMELGVKFRPNMLIGPVITLDDLLHDAYSAVFIGTGVWNPKPLRIKGETLGHVHYAINYLKTPAAYDLGKKVAVIGAGNVAMDAARMAMRNGAEEVTMLYRRGEEDMSATKHEYESAKAEGVTFSFYRSPVEIVDTGIRCAQTRKELDEKGNARVTAIENSEKLVNADSVIIAVSQAPRSNLKGIEIGTSGLIIADDHGRTTQEGLFASGDVVTGAKTVAEATYYSKRVARTIIEYLERKAA
ncbi:NAD(P)-dependent oxidoreductase [Halodesulfovibrio marinisediminis]|uniref:Glutamate synthase (NADPH/NADH) small chain n=1 Tax=Halodesulfovibrio marinisediminis DSM 17456 TaxID=1121457 RepID=A0A1N6J808_9BACT|nr:NAD(P)-dependent oxidoreductase [Halodesulfovibrio marinisediminis]SIO40484.1 glutamate synthase (NADPH/NADH) small chain [Halodesulfovibrio marinisediminis DSM 17456]